MPRVAIVTLTVTVFAIMRIFELGTRGAIDLPDMSKNHEAYAIAERLGALRKSKPLIETDSPLYLKRLVRELNTTFDGFYAPCSAFSVRCNRARLKNGVLQVRSPSASPEWFTPPHNYFSDGYGREIVASRKP